MTEKGDTMGMAKIRFIRIPIHIREPKEDLR